MKKYGFISNAFLIPKSEHFFLKAFSNTMGIVKPCKKQFKKGGSSQFRYVKWGLVILITLLVARIRVIAQTHMSIKEGIQISQNDIDERLSLGIDVITEPVRNILMKSVYNTPGSVKLLVSGTKLFPTVMIKFPDYNNNYSVENFQNMLFGTWSSGSAKAYYQEVSYNQFILDGTVYGWYIADNNKSYYGNSQGGQRATILAKEAAQKADVSVNYAQFDNDGDGYVDAFTCVHSGYGYEETNNGSNIWSHAWSFTDAGIGIYTTNDPDPNNPGQYIKINNYVIAPERSSYSNNGTMVCIGVFVHEWGHALGLPDLYDTDDGGEGLGNWCLMAGGSWGGDGNSPWKPVHLSAWAKMELGWLNPTAVRSPNTYSIPQVEVNSVAYWITSRERTFREYFLIENRRKTGFDELMLGQGIFIYHIDDSVITSRRSINRINAGGSGWKYGVALEQADGLDHLYTKTNRGDAGDPFPGSSVNTNFDSTATNPNSRTNYPLASTLVTGSFVKDIPASSSIMTPTLSSGVVGEFSGGPDQYGYHWIDSDTTGGPIYSWIDISETGTALGVGDEARYTFTLPYTFNFYNTSFNQIWVSTNGWLSFGSDPGTNAPSNMSIPNSSAPNQAVFVFWDDLKLLSSDGANIYYQNFGNAPNCYTVLSWTNARHKYDSQPSNRVSFQAILYENGTIILQYKDCVFGDHLYNWGRSASIGVENATGTAGLEYLNNGSPLGNLLISERAVRFLTPITLDQLREDNSRLLGTTIGRWTGSTFENYQVTNPPPTIVSSAGATEVLRGFQGIVSNPSEKYNHWRQNSEDVTDVRNHHVFQITPETINLTSYFKSTYPATIQAQISGGGNPEILVDFKDPWLIDYPDPSYGNNLRNQGLDATFKSVLSGTNNLGLGTIYKGVFLNQNLGFEPDKPIYRLKAPRIVATNSDIMVFDHWQSPSSSMAVFNSSGATTTTNRETPVVFKSANATVTAVYVSANATGRTVTVNAGETLSLPTNATYNITPGNFGIDVYGTLIINVSTSQPVTFQSNAASPSQSDWCGIKAHNGSAVAIRYVTLKNAQNPIWIFSNNSTSTRYIENCTVDNCYKGIIFDGSYVTSDYLYEELTIKNNLIKNSGSSSNPGPAIDVKGTFEDLKIENNIVQNCYGGLKVDIQYASRSQVTGAKIIIDHNVVHHLASSDDPEIGIEIIDTTPQYGTPIFNFAHVYNNTVDNIEGYGLYTDIARGEYWKVQNLIVSSISQSDGQAGYGIYNGGSTVLSVKYCDIYNCETGTTHGCSTYEIITDNPLFINPGSYDYHLQTNSPCVDAGNPNFDGDYVSYETDPEDQDPDHSRMDIGAYFCDYPPSTPTGFDGVWYNNHPKVFWNAVADPDLKEYQVWKKKNSGLWSLKGTTSNLFYVDNSESKWTKPLISATIYYKVCAVDEGDNTSGFTGSESFICNNTESDKKEIFPVVELNPIPTEYALHPAFPNPFNPRTTICYDVPTTSSVKVTVFDLLGREVRALVQGEAYPGFHRIEWDGANNFGATVSSGIYFIQMDCPEYHALIKCVLNR